MKVFAIETLNNFAIGADDVNTKNYRLENGGKKAVVLLPSDKVRALRPKNLGLNRCWRNGCPLDRKYKSVGRQSAYLTRLLHITAL